MPRHEAISDILFFVERFSAPNPTDSAHFHYFYHVPLTCQPVTHQRGRIWVARLVRLLSHLFARSSITRSLFRKNQRMDGSLS